LKKKKKVYEQRPTAFENEKHSLKRKGPSIYEQSLVTLVLLTKSYLISKLLAKTEKTTLLEKQWDIIGTFSNFVN
jgi:hypothetical protein